MTSQTTEDSIVMDDDPTLHPDHPEDHQPSGDQPLPLGVEALLLSTDRPLSEGKIAELLGLTLEDGGLATIREAINELNATYEQSNRSFRIEAVAGGQQILTTPEFGPVLHRLHQERLQTRLSPAALETLAIVAYRQPLLRAEVESIRGVACGEVLRGLMERRLVKIVGRAEELGRPMLYGTTREFLRVFGLPSLDELPRATELRQPSVPRSQMVGAKKPPGAAQDDDVMAQRANPGAAETEDGTSQPTDPPSQSPE